MSKRFLKSSCPSLLIKRAALGNLKASFHCTHWHRFFPLKKDFFESLRLPFQRELHLFSQALFPSGDKGCSWRRYSSARVLVSQAEPVP